MKRFLVRAPLVAGLLATGIGMFAASPVAAKAKPPSRLHGEAPGGITCDLSVIVKFGPALSDSGGGTHPTTISGTASNCTGMDPGMTISSGSVNASTSNFSASPFECVSNELEPTGAVGATISLKWHGDFTGTVSGVNYAGPMGVYPTTIEFQTVAVASTGEVTFGLTDPIIVPASSFEGSAGDMNTASAMFTSLSPAETFTSLSPLCDSKAAGGKGNGIRKLVLNAGMITIGA